jgi:hypothetical protein
VIHHTQKTRKLWPNLLAEKRKSLGKRARASVHWCGKSFWGRTRARLRLVTRKIDSSQTRASWVFHLERSGWRVERLAQRCLPPGEAGTCEAVPITSYGSPFLLRGLPRLLSALAEIRNRSRRLLPCRTKVRPCPFRARMFFIIGLSFFFRVEV